MRDITGRFARLPDGQEVVIEGVEGSTAIVRRIDGPRAGTKAVCSLAKLEVLADDRAKEPSQN